LNIRRHGVRNGFVRQALVALILGVLLALAIGSTPARAAEKASRRAPTPATVRAADGAGVVATTWFFAAAAQSGRGRRNGSSPKNPFQPQGRRRFVNRRAPAFTEGRELSRARTRSHARAVGRSRHATTRVTRASSSADPPPPEPPVAGGARGVAAAPAPSCPRGHSPTRTREELKHHVPS
jgi:hypothetical protein